MPKTPDELLAQLFQTGIASAYRKLADAALARRLDERAIKAIETGIVEAIGEMRHAAEEFRGFEAEPVVTEAQARLRALFEALRNERRK